MDDCCNDAARELAQLRDQGRVLVAVLAINAVMFAFEFAAGLFAGSAALLGDSLDMLGDTLVYGLTLYALSRGPVWQGRASLAKGLVMLAFGVGVLLETARKLFAGGPPEAHVIGAVGVIVLAANSVCFALLYRYRAAGLNMRSVWLCSRNDIIGNVAVLGAAGAVAAFGSAWPDLLVGAGIAILFLRTAVTVIRESVLALSQERATANRAI